MVMTSPYHTAPITAYPVIEESRSAPLIPEEVTNAHVQEERLAATRDATGVGILPRKEALPARIARGILAFYDWLSDPAMTDRERVYRDIANARSQWYGRLEQNRLS